MISRWQKLMVSVLAVAVLLTGVVLGDIKTYKDIWLLGDEKSVIWYNGAYSWGEKASSSMAGSYVIIKPPNIGSTGQQLTTTVSGNTSTWSWEAAGGVGGIGDIDDVGDAASGSVFTADGLGNSLWFEGSTADGIETILTVVDPTASDKTVTLPNATGYVVLDGTVCTDIEGTGLSIGGTTLNWSAVVDSIALTTHTTGNYANGDGEAGNALTGDTATAFFSAGTIEHEYGGLEADVSGYVNGLYGMAAGATADIDTIAEVETAIGGSTNILIETEIDASAELIALMDDETGTGALVFATSPTLVTPVLGTIASGVGTALTALNGENIQDDTIDDDSIDFGDVTGADLDLSDCGSITSTGTVTVDHIAEATASHDVVFDNDVEINASGDTPLHIKSDQALFLTFESTAVAGSVGFILSQGVGENNFSWGVQARPSGKYRIKDEKAGLTRYEIDTDGHHDFQAGNLTSTGDLFVANATTTGQILASNGTAGAPGISLGLLNTGMYRVIAGHTLGLSTLGVGRFTINSAGADFTVPVDITGTINTTSDDNWDLNDYTAAGDYAAAGYVTVTINDVEVRLLAYLAP